MELCAALLSAVDSIWEQELNGSRLAMLSRWTSSGPSGRGKCRQCREARGEIDVEAAVERN